MAWHLVTWGHEANVVRPERLRKLLAQGPTTHKLARLVPRKFLIFLAPRGWGCPQEKPDFHITYEDHIIKWLQDSDSPDLPLRLRGNLQQYREVIRHLSNGDTPMDTDILELLTEPENFICAISISQNIRRVEKHLDQLFWNAIYSDLKNVCDLFSQWEITVKRALEDPGASGDDAVIYISKRESNGLHLKIGIGQEGSYGCRFCGVRLSHKEPGALGLSQIISLRNDLKNTAKEVWEISDTDGM
jgi:hypothetical protein